MINMLLFLTISFFFNFASCSVAVLFIWHITAAITHRLAAITHRYACLAQ